jgi:AcrR family transcriptional regulator
MVKAMERRRFDNLASERQDRLYESAAEEFAARGYDGASLNRIIERAGMSKSSLYYYFNDKADLFTTLVERSIALLFKRIGDFDLDKLTAETFWSACEDVYLRAIQLLSGDAWYIKLGRMFYRLRGDPKRGAPTDRMFVMARRWLSAFVERGQALGVIRTDLPQSLLIDCAMGVAEPLDHWVVAHWDEMDEAARLAMPKAHIDLFRRMLSP